MRTVLHLLSAAGGGTERFVRELAEGLPGLRHLLLLVGAAGEAVVEDPIGGRYALLSEFSVDRRRVLGLLDRYAVDLVHVHWLSPATLPWIRELVGARRPYLLSLHDIGFLRSGAFEADGDPLASDPAWQANWQPLWQAAAAVTSPSDFIDQQWARVCAGCKPIRVAPGLANPAPLVEQRLAGHPTVGILGALGPHKGSEALDAILPLAAATDLRFVLIGYRDRQLHPGVSHGGRLTVHGPYLAGESSALIDRYQIDLIWFPNRMPESFSYALSEAWAAARPVLVPDAGALGERLHARGGGWLQQAPAEAAAVLADLQRYLPIARSADYRAELRRERAARVPSLADMLLAMQRLYDQIPTTEVCREPWADTELSTQLAEQLGALCFRQENIRLARDYAQAQDWIAHLRRDLALLQDARREEQVALRVDLARGGDRIVELEKQLAASAVEHAATLAAMQAAMQAQLAERDASLTQHRQQLSTLWSERAVLSIKAWRYDRVIRLIPVPLIRLARSLRSLLKGGR